MSPPRQRAQSSQRTAPIIQHAIVRDPGPDAAEGLTAQSGAPLCLEQLQHQHAAYCDALAALGVELIRLDPAPGFPDAYFVEDTAVVTPEIAIIARSGALERRGEEQSVARVLGRYRKLTEISAPGTLDGGDVLIVGRQVFIGLSRRTNPEGAAQLARVLARYDYRCTRVTVDDGLHLKSSVTHIGGRQLLLTAPWAARPGTWIRKFRQPAWAGATASSVGSRTMAPSASGKPVSRNWLIMGPICLGGKLTTPIIWRPTNSSTVYRSWISRFSR